MAQTTFILTLTADKHILLESAGRTFVAHDSYEFMSKCRTASIGFDVIADTLAALIAGGKAQLTVDDMIASALIPSLTKSVALA